MRKGLRRLVVRPAWRLLVLAAVATAPHAPALSAELPLKLEIGYLRQERILPPVLSNLDPVPEDLGLRGAELAIRDNATTGTFLNQEFVLSTQSVAPDGPFLDAAKSMLKRARLVLVDAPADSLLAVADLPEARDALLFNISAEDAALRNDDCRANLLHTIPETAMRTDGLMQVLKARRWERLVLISGQKENDLRYAAALRKSIEKFGLQLLAEKAWSFDTDLRLSASAEVPVLTQDFPEHDVLLVADENDDFSDYIEHNTWLPRLVAGTSGLMAENWTPSLEQWGAVQLQNRFEKLAGRTMRPRDFAAWAAVRAIGEAATRTGKAEAAALRAYMLSDGFRLDGFKGQPLGFRPWNGQLREPIAVFNEGAVVEMAPQQAFLHERNVLDTLGTDSPETTCSAFGDE